MTYQRLCQYANILSLPDPTNKFVIEEQIGEGTYGEVFRATDLTTGKSVAIKVLENVSENVEEIEEEFTILKDISHHPNLPEFYGLYLKKGPKAQDDQLWLVMEYCGGGTTTELVRGLKARGGSLSEDQIAYILYNTLQAIIYLHSNHCMHRDIKGHNILLTDEAEVKVIDFGVSSRLGATMGRRSTSVGTPYWMAPEVIACEQQLDCSYDARCDVWSLGITGIELAIGEPPLSDMHPMRALFHIPRNPAPKLQRSDCLLLRDFVADCLVKDFENRPVARRLMKHRLMKRVRKIADKIKKELVEEIRQQKFYKRNKVKPDVTTKHGKLKESRKSKATVMYVDDLATLDTLSEEVIVDQLQHRYESDRIYTYIGDILLAINPFTPLGLYSTMEQKRYTNKIRSENPPHIFSIADAAYQALLRQRTNQAIVISGESGAGKTESANLLLKQLVYLGKAVSKHLEERILQMNPLMEAFGNAQTGINGNSSRFGKYLELSLTNTGHISGARVYVYLLEHSRVVQQDHGESNFHVFYYLYDGLTNLNQLQEYHLDSELRQHHAYLSADKQDINTKKCNIQKFEEMRSAFQLIGFREEELDCVYKVLASVLHLGDIEFGEVISDDNTDNKSKIIDIAPLHRVSHLLGIDRFNLLECLTITRVVMRGEMITRNNSVLEAVAIRDAIAKALYSRLFDWLVGSINNLLSGQIRGEPHTIGILDIFGFENFAKNSFEQLCINIANEQIQYYFNRHIFTWEQQEYLSEGIPVDTIDFIDNKPVLDLLLSRPMGLLSLLDEESRFPRATDRSLIEKFHTNIKSKLYIRPKAYSLQFGIQHFAGRVMYQADNFLEKNRQFLPVDVNKLFCASGLHAVRYLFQCPISKTGNLFCSMPANLRPIPQMAFSNNTKSAPNALESNGATPSRRNQQTAASYFRHSLAELLHKMSAGSPQFVRCVKPNDGRTAHRFDPQKVLKQLRYTGVLETIRIRRHGFSHRIAFANFLKQYSFLAFSFEERLPPPTRENCRILLTRLKMDGWALGKSKVFLKYYHYEYLTKLYEEQIRKIVKVQAIVRGHLCRVRFAKLKKRMTFGALTLQRFVRGWLVRKNTRTVLRPKRVEPEPSEARYEPVCYNANVSIEQNNSHAANKTDKNNSVQQQLWNNQRNTYESMIKHQNQETVAELINDATRNNKVVAGTRPLSVYDSPRPFVQKGFVHEVSKKFADDAYYKVAKEDYKRPRILTMDVEKKKIAPSPNNYSKQLYMIQVQQPPHPNSRFWNVQQPTRMKITGAGSPSDFRRLLRPIHDPPTDSLKRRVNERYQIRRN